MILYCYDSEGLLVGPVSPSLSPARPFVNGKPNYLHPANTTELAPPSAAPGEVAVFNDLAWSLMEDHRGKAVYDTLTGLPGVMSELGPVPAGQTLEAPPSQCHVWQNGEWIEDSGRLLAAMRLERNARLTGTDWTQLADAPFIPQHKAAWAVYRQALRDHTIGWTKGKPWPQPPQE